MQVRFGSAIPLGIFDLDMSIPSLTSAIKSKPSSIQKKAKRRRKRPEKAVCAAATAGYSQLLL
jgi:hypothetical protein